MTTVNRIAEQSAPVLTSANWRTIASSAAHADGTTETWDWEQAESAGVVVVIDVTVATGGQSIVFTLQGVDPVSGAAYDILASAAVTATGTTKLKCRPGITTAANVAVADALPPRLRIKAVPADTKTCTYSISALHTA